MVHSFTQNQLVRFIYKETTAVENMMIGEALESDDELFNTYCELQDAYRELPRVKFSATRKSLKNILQYSKQVQATASY